MYFWNKGLTDVYKRQAEGTLPPKEELEQANLLTDLQKVQLDEEAQTVFLTEKGMSLDVGALAKGYATEKVGEELFNMGFKMCIRDRTWPAELILL